ncbi:AdeC/AdeK/OprM family multidrug efflux complex outer membrane factor [Acidovorax sp. SUPP3434]|uniref:efflux transporter outer membrane subunit n=1 Tax=Acidovorax sp. SUPP3434 TaxID=2920880 RepID=UPI0023DE2DA2|nr:efflux transporter outer membrane subunit [Acidovorax sp. SUPP3434]GKT02110.1 AdeC/AdeK/OprM family multidrug efflux complex outer membrane factor [Acidovorax sp. SUPP3434]
MTAISTYLRVGALSAVCLMAGCTSLAPHYAQPALPVPASIGAPLNGTGQAISVNMAEMGWRDVFVDPRLQQVIASALDHNRDLRIAVLNIDKARAQYRIQRAALFPAVDVGGGLNASRSSASTSITGRSQVARVYSADIGLSSWELDLFGRIRSLNNQALETFLSTEQAQRAARLSLVAETADAWLTVGAYQARLDLATQTLTNQQRALALTQHLHERGVVSGLDLSQVQSSVESARTEVASFRSELARARNALDLVVGASVPEALLAPALDTGQAGVALVALPDALESSVLLLRPDVLAAEHSLKAATADIGAARAAFFPSISLTASTGRSSTELDNLFRSGNRTWSFVPSINIPIFQGGALRAQLDVARIQANIQIAEYEKSIQTAFREVADGLAERQHLQEQLDAQGALVAASGRSYRLADARYRNGAVSYLEALDAQRSLYTSQQTLIGLQLTEASNRVLLYKTLGGGADADAVAVTE